MPEDSRDRSDRILAGLMREAQKQRRGRLRAFFGMSPGVGKTFAMLSAAHEQAKAGRRVLVGVVETHSRQETAALVAGLEVLPRRTVDHREATIDEMDLDGILAAKPDLVLIDELAHTNAPGSRHAKRYQDVEEVLLAGIDVYTTMNVQHLESRADLVHQITGAVVRETVPDSFLENANQIELVDLSPEELLKRLKEGKVYIGDRAERAAQNFFKVENLTALREMALRFTAEKVDSELQDRLTLVPKDEAWKTSERLLVAISHSPSSVGLIRTTRKLAFILEAPWIALRVDTGHILSFEDENQLKKNIELARELGAEILFLRDDDPAEAIGRIAKERNITQIVVGRPDRRPLMDLLRRGHILDRLTLASGNTDILVVRSEKAPVNRGARWVFSTMELGGLTSYWATLWFLLAVSCIAEALHSWMGYQAVGFLYLAGVLITASLAPLGPTIFAAIFSAIVWNFFFIPPIYTFVITAPEDIMMMGAYFLASFVGGWLTTRIRRQEKDLAVREERTRLLYTVTRDLSQAKSVASLAAVMSHFTESVFKARCEILTVDETGRLTQKPIGVGAQPISDKGYAVADWAHTNNKKAGWGTETLNSAKCLCIPLRGRDEKIGVYLFFPGKLKSLKLEAENLLETALHQLAVAMERMMLEDKAQAARFLRESERLHQTLLNSVSHELRTPLTALLGTATAFLDDKLSQDPKIRKTLAEDLCDSVERLNRVVENLLDMSRLNRGSLAIKDDVFDLNELLHGLVQREQRMFRHRSIVLALSADSLYVRGDEKLLEHAFSNLLVNAVAYTPRETVISILSRVAGGSVVVEIMDEGPGIPEDQLERVFERFYRLPESTAGGTGLGLSIVRGLVEAHRGEVVVVNRSDRSGCIFRLTFPKVELPKDVAGALL